MASLGLAYLLTGDGDCSPRLAHQYISDIVACCRF